MPGKGINITDPTAFYESSTTNITLVVMTREVSFFFFHFDFRYDSYYILDSVTRNDKKTIFLTVCH